MYRYGQGLPRNQERASYWITMAAKNGCQKAQTALQLMRLKDDTQKALENKAANMTGSCSGDEQQDKQP
jgi:TPR repeat protein